MADPSTTLVFQWLAAGDAGDLDAFDELLHANVVVHAPRGLSTVNVEDEKAVWREALTSIPDLHHEVQEVLVDDDREMARVVVTGTLQSHFAGVTATGHRFRIDQAVIAHVREGKIVEAWEIADVAALDADTQRG